MISNTLKKACDVSDLYGVYGVFVTAKLRGKDEARQGWIVALDFEQNTFTIRGQSGTRYECEGTPTVVSNPPE